MRKKSGFTIVAQAIELVPEFEKVVRKLVNWIDDLIPGVVSFCAVNW